MLLLYENRASMVPIPLPTIITFNIIFVFVYRVGDIKFSTDPYKNVKRIKTFGFLRSSLKKGRRVRMAADLSKCSGSHPNTLTEIGGEIRGMS